MVFEYLPLFLSITGLGIVRGIDEATSEMNGSPRLQAISRMLFSSYRRTVIVYSICILGILLKPLLDGLPYLLVSPVFVVLYAFFGGMVILPSIGFAKLRAKKLKDTQILLSFIDENEEDWDD